MNACQTPNVSYSIEETGATARYDCRALGQSSSFGILAFRPGMEVIVPAGASLFHLTTNKGHDQSGRDSGQDVEQELLHKATSFRRAAPSILYPTALPRARGGFFCLGRNGASKQKQNREPDNQR